MKALFLISVVIGISISCANTSNGNNEETAKATLNHTNKVQDTTDTLVKVVKTKEEWKEILTDEEFIVLREQGTERAFSGDLLDNKKEGIYTCAGCALPLFESRTKFDSGTGWPSFYAVYNKNFVGEKADNKYGWNRVEVVCNRCDGHLGHVFNDGPKPTNLRYCINSVSLNFEEKK